MPRFSASATVTISLHAIVDAKNKKEAKEIAESLGMPSLCFQCAGGNAHVGDEEWSLSGEFDGEPQGIEVEPR